MNGKKPKDTASLVSIVLLVVLIPINTLLTILKIWYFAGLTSGLEIAAIAWVSALVAKKKCQPLSDEEH